MSVWDDLVGQGAAVTELRRAAEGSSMTHAWLFTGPPGSGRSTAARAFAAALQCERAGCGECQACRTVLAGSHADVRVLRTETLSIAIDEARRVVLEAARSPAGGRWQVIVVEDVDRLGERAANVWLKAIEEPTPRTVWLLCAPALEDVTPTIRSRCRHVGLRTPPPGAVAELLIRRDGVDPAMAHFAARASQGHIGRARRLATDDQARARRHEALNIPTQVSGVADCLVAAANLVDGAGEEATASTTAADEREGAELARALGAGTLGRAAPTGTSGQLKDLEKRQKMRQTRVRRDALDRSLVDLASLYRDVLATQVGADVSLVNDESRPAIARLAAGGTPEQTLRRIEAILECRTRIDANVAPLLAVEAMTLALRP